MRRIVKIILRKVIQILFRVCVEGFSVKLDSPRLMIIANHESFLDGLLLGLFLPYDPVFVVHTGVTRNIFFRAVLSLVDYCAVDPTNPMAVKTVIKAIEEGRPVVVFPEGRITVTGSLMKVYDGPAFVAAKTGATVLPVRLDGPARTYFSRQSGKQPRRMFPRVTLSVQNPVSIAMPDAASAKLRRRRAGEAMRRIMQKMFVDSRRKQTLYSALLDAMAVYGRGGKIAEDIRGVYSYGDLLKMTLMLGRMTEKHTEPGETVGILMPNLAATVCALIGSTARGRIPAMLNYKAGAVGMQDACTAAGVKTIIASRAFIDQAKLGNDVSAIKNVDIIYLEDLRRQVNFADKLRVLKGMIVPSSVEQYANPSRPAVVLFTSGSEGRPKGVVLSHDALLANIAQIRSVIDFTMEDKVLNALPIFHSFGLTGGALLPIMTGMRVFLYPTPLHYRVIPEIAYDRKCSILFGTSTFLANYAKFAHPYDFFRLRYVVAGAEKLSQSVRDVWFEKFGIRILEGYGATETAPVLSVNTPLAYRSGTVGQLLPGIRYRLLPVPGIDTGSMLHVSGPNVMTGYFRFDAPGRIQPTASIAGSGWYETGDVVSIDDDGYVSVIGRVKRFAKVAGEMVSLDLVEKVAALAAPSALHGAAARTDGARGETIVLFTTGADVTREIIVDSARKLGVPEISVPRKIIRVDSLPLLGTGKIDYAALKRLAEAA